MTELRKQINNIVEDHQACLTLAKSMNGNEVYDGTTATAEDILEGKTAYSNGELLIGTKQFNDYNSTLDIEDRTIFTFANILKEIDFSNIDTSKITTFNDAFTDCKYLEKIIGKIDCSSATSAVRMFSKCSSLSEVLLSNTGNMTNMSLMFNNCSNLTQINLSDFDTSKVTTFSKTFYGCKSLVTIPVLDMSGVTDFTGFMNTFNGCDSLSDESLNNILESCITAQITSTLAYMGLSGVVETTKWDSLPSYQAFLDAGWTKGY